MKIRSSHLALLIVIFAAIVWFYQRYEFNYISLQPVLGYEATTEYAAKFVYSEPSKDQVTGMAIYVNRSFYIEDNQEKNVNLTVSMVENVGREKIITNQTWSMDSFEVKGFQKLFFDSPIDNPEGKPLVFTFTTSSLSNEGEMFNIITNDVLDSDKYEIPRLILHDSVKEIFQEGKTHFKQDAAFAGPYTVAMIMLLIVICVLFIIDFDPTPHRK